MLDNVEVDEFRGIRVLNIISVILGLLIAAIFVVVGVAIVNKNTNLNSNVSYVKEKVLAYDVCEYNGEIFIKCETNLSTYSFNINSRNIGRIDENSGFVLTNTRLYLSSDDLENINEQLRNYDVYLSIIDE